MELSTFSLAELKTLLNEIPAEIKSREKAEKASALRDIEALASERGFSLSELLGGDVPAKGKKERSPVAVKYRHPQNADLAWTGRGRQPKWIVEYLANGGALASLAV